MKQYRRRARNLKPLLSTALLAIQPFVTTNRFSPEGLALDDCHYIEDLTGECRFFRWVRRKFSNLLLKFRKNKAKIEDDIVWVDASDPNDGPDVPSHHQHNKYCGRDHNYNDLAENSDLSSNEFKNSRLVLLPQSEDEQNPPKRPTTESSKSRSSRAASNRVAEDARPKQGKAKRSKDNRVTEVDKAIQNETRRNKSSELLVQRISRVGQSHCVQQADLMNQLTRIQKRRS